LAEELSDLGRGIALLSINQGFQRTAIPVRAIQALQEDGNPASDKAILHLKLIAQAVRMGIDDVYDINKQLVNLETLLQKQPDLLFCSMNGWRGMLSRLITHMKA